MSEITLVTGNPNKLAELEAIFPAELKLRSQKLAVDEIQSLDLHEIVSHKLRQAYQIIKAPVIVEDVSAEVEKLNGLPGPFIKFFEERLGRGALYQLAGESRARIICGMGYYDGTTEILVDGIVEGEIVGPRDGEGWGFDFEFIPDGYDKTNSQLGPKVKNQISHRAVAAGLMAEKLRSL
jgi:non-canonical purine NTP pyrophosphatase (RdgB/HAM1 family)